MSLLRLAPTWNSRFILERTRGRILHPHFMLLFTIYLRKALSLSGYYMNGMPLYVEFNALIPLPLDEHLPKTQCCDPAGRRLPSTG
jgi:hypothetical protein